MKREKNPDNRRKFLKNTLAFSAAAFSVGSGVSFANKSNNKDKIEKIKVLTTDGKVVEIERPVDDCKIDPCAPPIGKDARQGIPGRSFVMVIDLARCKNARKCIEGCQKGHNLSPDQEWLKVYLI